jgi:hypothetical protein
MLLAAARGAGYRVVGIDQWVMEGASPASRYLILRHDVDQQPPSALKMASIDADFGVRGTWYFRWRTAHPRVVTAIAERGNSIGLHYETLTRTVRARGISEVTDALLEECRQTLRREVEVFRQRFGEIRSICPHGDTRVPGTHNHALVRGVDPAGFGVMFDGNEIMRDRRLGAWITDRRDPFSWKDGTDPHELFASGATPILAVVHPNNWSPRFRVVVDRALRVPPLLRTAIGPVRSGADEPPL